MRAGCAGGAAVGTFARPWRFNHAAVVRRQGAGRIVKQRPSATESEMNQVIYIIGLVVVIMAVLAFVGLR